MFVKIWFFHSTNHSARSLKGSSGNAATTNTCNVEPISIAGSPSIPQNSVWINISRNITGIHNTMLHVTAFTEHEVDSCFGSFFHIYNRSRIAGISAVVNRNITSILVEIYSLTHCLISAHNLFRASLDVASICCLEPKNNSNQSVS